MVVDVIYDSKIVSGLAKRVAVVDTAAVIVNVEKESR